jgi:hypothetical protein
MHTKTGSGFAESAVAEPLMKNISGSTLASVMESDRLHHANWSVIKKKSKTKIICMKWENKMRWGYPSPNFRLNFSRLMDFNMTKRKARKLLKRWKQFIAVC